MMRISLLAIALVLGLASHEGTLLAGLKVSNARGLTQTTSLRHTSEPPMANEPTSNATPTKKESAASLAAPPQLEVEVEAFDPNRLLLTLRRKGYLVALRAGGRASAAVDWVSAEIDNAPASALGLTWETTHEHTLETERGALRLTSSDGHPSVTSEPLPPPPIVATEKRRLHACQAFEAASAAFTVVCRVASHAVKLAAVNVTEPSPSSDVTKMTQREHVVRFDLPISEGTAGARMMGYLDGITVVVVRAEATWATGETSPTLLLSAATRRQPQLAFTISDREWLF